MTLDRFPDELEDFVSRINAALHGEITSARAIVERANAEKTAAANALANLQAQCKSAQDQLELTTREFDRFSELVGVGHDIEKARKELARLKAETEKEVKALAALSKERSECQAKVNALAGEVGPLVAQRAYSQEVMAKLKHQIDQLGV
jgi:chromosome segregation ATPase